MRPVAYFFYATDR